MRYFLYIFLFCSFSYGQTIFLTNDDIKAFPTAKGFGGVADGGRGGTVVHVTNLNTSGAGSLDAAINSTGARYIVFDVGGEITWTSEVVLSSTEGNVSILGQTAPSPGITIRGGTLRISGSDVIARFLRIRKANNAFDNDALRVVNTSSGTTINNIALDHLSLTWADDENFSITGNVPNNASVDNVTLQNSIIAENIEGTHYAALIYAQVDNISLIQNYWANNQNRIPENTEPTGSSGASIEFVNNLLYNYNRPVTVGWGPTIFDSVGNIFKADGDYPPAQANHYYQLNSFENPGASINDGTIYQADNLQLNTNSFGMMNSDWTSVNQSSRGITTSPYTPLSTTGLADIVLNNVGPSTLFADAVDARLIGDWTDENGVQTITDIATVGGFPSISSTSHPAGYDTDGDGLSDAYEDAQTAAYGGAEDSINPNDRPAQARIADGTTIDQTGVTSYASAGYTHMDIFAADLAGDWDSFVPQGSGTVFSAAKSSQAILIAN